jgi:hypothetical protein
MSTYQDEIRPWAIFRCRETGNICVARFRKRSDADSYLSLLRRLTPGNFVVAFDRPRQEVV